MADFSGLLKASSSIEFRDSNGHKRFLTAAFDGVPHNPQRDPTEELTDLLLNVNGVVESTAKSLQE